MRGVIAGTTEDRADVAVPTALYIRETLAACRESGRSARRHKRQPMSRCLDPPRPHDLAAQITVVASLIGEAVTALDASPAEFAVITISPSDIQSGTGPRSPQYRLGQNAPRRRSPEVSGAGAVVTSMANLARRLRARFTA
jgi:hypothetical protein